MMTERPTSEIYRDGFVDGIASARRGIQMCIDTLTTGGLPVDGTTSAALRGIVDGLDWALHSPNTDQAIAHWKAVQAENM